MEQAKNVPAGKKIVTEVTEVPGGSIEYRLNAELTQRHLDRDEVRRAVDMAVRSFRDSRTRSKHA